MRLRLVHLATLLLCAAPAGAAPLVFTPASGMRAEVTSVSSEAGQTVTVVLRQPGGVTTSTIAIASEQPLELAAEDLDFDGHRDLSISHLDDGKGTYRLYDIHLYSPRERRFIQARPTCGDDFIEIKVERSKRRLLNTYMDMTDRIWRTCVLRLRQDREKARHVGFVPGVAPDTTPAGIIRSFDATFLATRNGAHKRCMMQGKIRSAQPGSPETPAACTAPARRFCSSTRRTPPSAAAFRASSCRRWACSAWAAR